MTTNTSAKYADTVTVTERESLSGTPVFVISWSTPKSKQTVMRATRQEADQVATQKRQTLAKRYGK